jgi:hypothetical protein
MPGGSQVDYTSDMQTLQVQSRGTQHAKPYSTLGGWGQVSGPQKKSNPQKFCERGNSIQDIRAGSNLWYMTALSTSW